MVAEMIHSDIDTAVKVFGKLYRKVWDEEYIPDDWNKGLITTMPKKGTSQIAVTSDVSP